MHNGNNMKKVSILGSGNIGCDLLVKCIKEKDIELVSIGGRNADSKGLKFAKTYGIPTSDRSIQGIISDFKKPDIIIDATNALDHHRNYEIAKANGIKIIDMTPSKIGESCCPIVNIKKCLNQDNISMISCGGQSAMPICHAIKLVNKGLTYIEVVSTISSASAGPATRKNISQYISSTEEAISKMLEIDKVKIILNITPALPPIEMSTTILIKKEDIVDIQRTWDEIQEISRKTREYVPGYKNNLPLKEIGEKIICQIKVNGSGDYLPKYAGNLDIINCAAIEVVKQLND